MKTETAPNQRLGSIMRYGHKLKSGKILQTLLTRDYLLLLPAAFFLGRASLIGGLMPFGLPLYAATMGQKVNRVLVAVSIIIGMVSNGAKEQIYITAAAMLLFNAINIPFKENRPKLSFRHAVIAFISVLIPEIVTVYLQGFLLYDLLKALFHGFIAFSLVFIFNNIMPLMAEGRKKHAFTNEETISVAILVAIALSGLGDIKVLGFGVKNVFCILSVLLFSFKCGTGVGAAMGVTVGLIISVSSTVTPLVIASYAFCGLLAGVLRNLGKAGSCLGFAMGNTILTLYLNGSAETIIYLKEIILAIAGFLIIPQRLIDIITGSFNKNLDIFSEKRGYSARIKEITIDRLNKFSRAFKELSKTFSEISETKVVTDKQDISTLFDRVADRICKDCSLCLYCWDRNFYNTYQVMFKIVERLDSKGRIEESDIPGYFLERCERLNDFVEAVNNIYEIFKVDMVWKNKIGESRGLVSQQLEGLSNVISNLASEIDMDIHFKSDLEDIILTELNKAGIKASEAVVYENKWGKHEISVFHKGCGGRRACISIIEKIVSDVVGRKMSKENNECFMASKGNVCSLRLVEEEIFRVTTGVAKVTKYGSTVSGDSHAFMNTGDGKYIAALSDGMGTGQRAAIQSKATISLLEQFMESGFDKDTTIKLINSILVLKSSDESFTTIDLSLIDLFKGEVEFVKIGAAPTYIKRDDKVETIKSVSLPAGILSNIDLELVHKKVDSGDFIIMMTDGILDAFNNEEDEKALLNYIQGIKSTNPQEIADSILDKAYSNCGGKPVDDMLVMVAKVWKRTG